MENRGKETAKNREGANNSNVIPSFIYNPSMRGNLLVFMFCDLPTKIAKSSSPLYYGVGGGVSGGGGGGGGGVKKGGKEMGVRALSSLSQPPPDWPSAGRVEFHSVTLSYRCLLHSVPLCPNVFHTPAHREDHPLALDHVSFVAKPGEKVCVCIYSGTSP